MTALPFSLVSRATTWTGKEAPHARDHDPSQEGPGRKPDAGDAHRCPPPEATFCLPAHRRGNAGRRQSNAGPAPRRSWPPCRKEAAAWPNSLDSVWCGYADTRMGS